MKNKFNQVTYSSYKETDRAVTLTSVDLGMYGGGSKTLITDNKYTVRRLTPLECCRLQGFPDWWCDGVEGSDTAQYKMWGNGVALPCVLYIMEGIVSCEEELDNG